MTTSAHPHTDVLAAFALGDIDAPTRQRLSDHVAGCTACRAAVTSLAETAAALAAWPDEDPPDDGLERVLARIATPREAPRAVAAVPTGWLGAALRILAGVLLGAGVISLLGAQLATLPLWTRLSLAAPLRAWGGIGLAAIIFFVIGSFFTLALAPVLLLERSEAEGRRRLALIAPRS